MLAISVASLSSVYSCSEDWEDTYLEVDQTALNVSKGGETKTLSIQTNTDWKIVAKDTTWVSFDKTSGKGNSEVQITIGSNSSNERSTTLTLWAGTEFVKIEIEQAASTTGKLSVSTENCTIKRQKIGSQYEFTITAEYYVQNGHLASEAGILFGNAASKTTGTITSGFHTATIYVKSTSPTYTVTYQAYAVKKSNGAKVYGTSKTKKY